MLDNAAFVAIVSFAVLIAAYFTYGRFIAQLAGVRVAIRGGGGIDLDGEPQPVPTEEQVAIDAAHSG